MDDGTYNQSIKADLIKICKMMLTVDPEKRPSARQLLDDDFFTKNKPFACEPSQLFAEI